MPSLLAAASRPDALAGSRTRTTADVRPMSRRAARAAQAVAPAPRMVALDGAVTPASARAATMPGTSVLYPYRSPPSKTTVLAPPTSTASGSVRSSSGSTARFSGMVSERPTQLGHWRSQEASRAGSLASSHSIAV
jgi:hypothetical protein